MTRVEARDRLLPLMAELSEEHWCASWLCDLEIDLQAVLDGGPATYLGLSPMTDTDFNNLKILRNTAKGWWTWADDDHCVKFVADPGTEEPGIEIISKDW
jgi:hypothetical protein